MSSAFQAATNPEAPKETPAICDLAGLRVTNSDYLRTEPFPYVIHPQFIDQESYEDLSRSFPSCPPSTGPTGFSLYWGDEGYARLLEDQPAWRALFDTFHSQEFIDWGKSLFAGVWEDAGCRINLSEARYVPYREDRIDKELASLRTIEHKPEELWVRMDIHQGQMGYDRGIHVDHARRLISMLIYMCDHSENGMVGGELFLHQGLKPQRHEVPVRVTPRHNLMVAFPCTARSYHSVSKITSTAIPRNYIQVHISSSVDIWPREPAPWSLRRKLGDLKRRIID